jgi:hypothetical protein
VFGVGSWFVCLFVCLFGGVSQAGEMVKTTGRTRRSTDPTISTLEILVGTKKETHLQ